jgi:hypothetical protein
LIFAVILNIIMYIGAAVLFFTGYGIWALICFILAALLSLVLSGGKFNPFELFD